MLKRYEPAGAASELLEKAMRLCEGAYGIPFGA